LSEANEIFTEPDAESKADDIESAMRDIEKTDQSLKRTARTGRQGSQRRYRNFHHSLHVWPFTGNSLVIPDSGTESESKIDSESEDELAWKKRSEKLIILWLDVKVRG